MGTDEVDAALTMPGRESGWDATRRARLLLTTARLPVPLPVLLECGEPGEEGDGDGLLDVTKLANGPQVAP